MRVRRGFSQVLGFAALAAVISACDDGEVVIGDAMITCGNGVVDVGEQCDDGNTVDGDGCSALCQTESDGPTCGDNVVEGNEECDDGNTNDGDGCSATCTRESIPMCGDGNVDDGEECDDGNLENGDGCSADCAVEDPDPRCGDGNVDDGEECDDGNTDNGDGCDENCAIEQEAGCGDGNVDEGEACDDGNLENGDGCDDQCQLEPACGDGNVDEGEACDDGNLDNGDGCDDQCQLEAACGDGNVDDGEQCDDGNTDDGDGCSSECAIEAVCGNGELEGEEACDDGNTDDGDGCAADCTFEPAVCGDGILQEGESCDDGNVLAADGCSPECQEEIECIIVDDCDVDEFCARGYCVDEEPAPVCGDGLVEGMEQCDDGNLDAGDGCDAECLIEIPDPVCGNGIVEEPEQCDDGNLANDDGCSEQCQVEGCGNGLVEEGEECDDGNLDAGDGCDAECLIEVICGDGIVTGDETCDDGNVEPGDGCDPLCQIEPICGNGVIEGPEECDDGNLDPMDGCDPECRLDIVCGNGVVQAGEQCDDGNLDPMDGCSPECAIEDGFVFPVAPLGECVQVGGDLDEMDPVWDRPGAGIDVCAPGDGNDHFFETFRFTNNTMQPQFIDVRAAWGGDGFLHIFRDPFAADMLGMGCLDGDDDFNGTRASLVEGFNLMPGMTVVIIASTFGPNAAIGPYTVEVCTVPPPARCGDGIVQEENGEECDDGNLDLEDGCDDRCQREPLCGDGFVDGEEECDDGNVDNGDGCDDQCQREPLCGDSFIDGEEQCDDGNVENGDGCDENCAFESECGNGELEGLEQCDDGNVDAGDGCNEACEVEQPDAVEIAERGGTIELAGALEEGDPQWARPGANCAPGFAADRYYEFFRIVNNTGADQQLTVTAAWQGDGYLHVFEDPFNPAVVDGCVIGDDDFNGINGSQVVNVEIPAGATLVVVASTFSPNAAIGDFTIEVLTQHVCGDGLVGEGVEECDDGNLDNGDGCNDACLIEAECGDGVVGLGETCDDGNTDNGDGCDENCIIEPGCGNGIIEDEEECDDGNLDNLDGCSDACLIEIICGDGDLGEGEECDDGNLDNGDGCSDACVIELVCGDGFLAPGEDCDDGNNEPGDGCSPMCTLEEGPLPIAPRDQAINVAGSIDDMDPRWARPNPDCTPTVGADHFFETVTVVNNTGADQSLRITANWNGDGYLHVFRMPFDPAGLDTCVLGDDDFQGIGASRIDTVAIADGEMLVIVASTFGANQPIGDYQLEVYTLPVCGDGEVQGAEECDDGNLDDGDGCNSLCVVEPDGVCGDGVINPGEECDDGNLEPMDGCSPECTLELPMGECGNGIIEPPEECDDGNLDNDDGCSDACLNEAICGNGIPEEGEGCDDGNNDPGDGCSPECQIEIMAMPIAPRDQSVQVEGVIEAGDNQWERANANCAPAPGDLHFFDSYAFVNETGEPQRLRVTANWPEGDGYLHAFRQPFNPANLDTCVIGDDDEVIDGAPGVRASRIVDLPIAPGEVIVIVASTFAANAEIGPYNIEVYTQPLCGDLAVQGAEECDDGNLDNGDGCDDQCQIEPACGDGNVDDEVGEECDDGNLDNGDGCDDQCQREPECGDGFVDDPEQCDDGNLDAGDGCAADCTFEQECGNGEVEGTEECDDGNLDNGDGCDALCTFEVVDLIRGRELRQGAAADGQRDDYRFTVDHTQSRLVVFTGDGEGGCPAGNDTTIGIFPENEDGTTGDRIAFNDDGGAGLCSRVDTLLDAGNYVVRVQGFGNPPAGLPGYTLDYRLDTNVTAGGDFDGAFVQNGNDVFVFDFAEDTDAAFETGDGAGGCPGDTRMNIFPIVDGERGEAIFNDDGGPGLCSRIARVFPAGRYEVVVDGFGGRAIPDYVLRVAFAGECGDGEINDGEECDDGNVDAGDGCSPECTIEPGCGNGQIDEGEACDDGNIDAGDGCGPDCQFEVFCGNGNIDDGEQCDDGNQDAGDGCDAACQFEQECGNGEVEGTEECDDGNVDNGDGCDSACTNENFAFAQGIETRQSVGTAFGARDFWRFTVDNDGTVVSAETGDGEGGCAGVGDTFMRFFSVNPDGTLSGEPGLATDDDGGVGLCSRIERVLDAGEYVVTVEDLGRNGVQPPYTIVFRNALDVSAGGAFNGAFVQNGNDVYTFTFEEATTVAFATTNGADGCPGDTRLSIFPIVDGERGDVIFNDDGGVGTCSLINQEFAAGTYEVVVDGFGGRAIPAYTLAVTFAGECGDGEINVGEACDDGNVDNGDGCDANCQFEVFCGNGNVDEGEQCDDGNIDAGDGCDANCQREQVCGDGFVDGDEQCDDGNVDAGDGCAADCTFEQECGNGEIEGSELCDDGNVDNGDGCDELCTFEVQDLVESIETRDNATARGERDDYRFTVDHTQGRLVAETTGCRVGNDTTLALFPVNEDGTLGDRLVFNDDGGEGLCSRIDRLLDAGNYLLRVQGFGGVPQPLPGYTLEYRLETNVSEGGDFNGAVAVGGDDLFIFTTDGPGNVRLETSDGAGACGFDTRMELFRIDENGERVDRVFNDDGGPGLCSLINAPIGPGTYEVVIDEFGRNAAIDYNLNVQFTACGNGEVEGPEQCDDGNNDAGDGCSPTCEIEPGCGNGQIDEGEACDDGNLDNGDGCDDQCQFEVQCGNGNVDDGEQCDDGNVDNGDGCDENCQFEQECGNGEVEGTEQCDDGNVDNGDGCDAVCTFEVVALPQGREFRENNATQAGQRDDYTFTVDHTQARVVAFTGDGEGGCPAGNDTTIAIFPVNEDGTTGDRLSFNDDGGAGLCSRLDQLLDAGDYLIRVQGFGADPRALPGYRLDYRQIVDVSAGGDFDGGLAVGGTDLFEFTVDADTTATLSTSNGEGGCGFDTRLRVFPIVDGVRGDQLYFNDDGGPGLCSLLTDVAFAAGTYVAEVDEFGRNAAIADYTFTITFAGPAPACGDGNLDDGEECDDGNLDAGDGCDANCLIEEGPACGDGNVDDGEACDDGNLDNGDGCDENCQLEAACGDGNVDDGEQCDDGNLDNGDGCDDQCQFEQECGNGEVEGDEQCDDGNVDNGDGCDALCTFEVVALPQGREFRENNATQLGQRDDYTFTVDHTPARVVAFTGDGQGGCPAGNDTTIAIFPVNPDGTTGNRLFFNDDGGAGLCSRLDEELDAGDYLIRVQGFGANPAGLPGYRLDYRQIVDASAGGDFAGGLAVGGTDLFEFTVAEDTTATLRTSNGADGCPGDTRLRVFPVVDGARGAELFFNDDGGAGLCSLLTDRPFPAGTYVAEVDEFGRNLAIADYTFTITFPAPEPVCGNGEVEEGETCDDGNLDAGDGCDDQCQTEAACGNGAVEDGEECDDGNLDNGDGCDAECSNEFFARNVAVIEEDSRMAAGSSDTFRFVLDAPGRVLFFTSDGGFGCPADTRGRLFAVNEDGTRGNQIGADINDGFNPVFPQCAGGLAQGLDAGTYEIEIGEQNGGAIADYQVDILVAVDAAIESSNQGTIPVGGTDGYYFEVENPDTELAIFTDTNIDGSCNRDTVMQIFTISLQTGQLVPLVNNDDGGVGVCSRVQQVFQPGNYAVVVNEFGNNGPIEEYNLNVQCISCRQAAVPAPGQLQITEIMQNPTNPGDATGEYFEVLNTGDTDVDIFGMILSDDDVDSHTVTESAVIAAGEYAVFARNGNDAENGGLGAIYQYEGFFLGNSSDEVVISNWRGLELDRVVYDNGDTFPDPAGASMQFSLDGDADADNNDGSLWCESQNAFNGADNGTPGAANDCPAVGGQVFNLAYQGFDISENPLQINVGDTVIWTNNDQAIHDVVSGDPGDMDAGALFDSGALGQGDTFEFTFDAPGEYRYYCSPHQGFMRDYIIQVVDPNALQ